MVRVPLGVLGAVREVIARHRGAEVQMAERRPPKPDAVGSTPTRLAAETTVEAAPTSAAVNPAASGPPAALGLPTRLGEAAGPPPPVRSNGGTYESQASRFLRLGGKKG